MAPRAVICSFNGVRHPMFMRPCHSRRRALLAIAMSTTALLAQPAAAADAPADSTPAASGANAEIVVTAEKRASTVQSTPISMTAISGEQLAARGITQMMAVIQSTPGLSTRSAGPGQTELEARGLASSGGSSPTVGFYLDDTPLNPPAAAQVGKVVIDPDLFDLKRVEVLRGPQGTLYGSGSMGGTVKLVTNEPDPSGIHAAVDGNISATQSGGINGGGSVMINLPLADNAALRVVATDKHRSGWIDRVVLSDFPAETNPNCAPFNGCTRGDVAHAPVAKTYHDVNDVDLQNVRASLLLQPTDRLKLVGTFFWQLIRQGGYDEFDIPPGSTRMAHYSAVDTAEPIRDVVTIGSLSATYAFDGVSLTSATSYWKRSLSQTQDASESVYNLFGLSSYVPVPYSEVDPSHQFSEEVRLASTGTSPLQWVAGLFYSDFHSTWIELSANPALSGLSPAGTNPDGILFDSNNPYHIIQYAAFGEASYTFSPELKFTAGVRYFNYKSTMTNDQWGIASQTGTADHLVEYIEAKDHGFNPKFNLSYTPSRDLTLYGTIAKGFRPGGVNQSVPVSGPGSCLASLQAVGLNQVPHSFGPDSIWNYEVGEKARLAGGRLTINSSLFYLSWQNVQQNVALTCGYLYTANAGKGHSYGPETEITAQVTKSLTLTLSGNYIAASIDKVNAQTGLVAPLPILNVPKYTVNGSVVYAHEVGKDATLVTRISDVFVGPVKDQAYFYYDIPTYNLVNFRTSLEKGPMTLALFVDNVTNKHAIYSINNTSFQFNMPALMRASTNQPRTFGFDVGYRF
jgi:iron complex outermembrane recepter protein